MRLRPGLWTLLGELTANLLTPDSVAGFGGRKRGCGGTKGEAGRKGKG